MPRCTSRRSSAAPQLQTIVNIKSRRVDPRQHLLQCLAHRSPLLGVTLRTSNYSWCVDQPFPLELLQDLRHRLPLIDRLLRFSFRLHHRLVSSSSFAPLRGRRRRRHSRGGGSLLSPHGRGLASQPHSVELNRYFSSFGGEDRRSVSDSTFAIDCIGALSARYSASIIMPRLPSSCNCCSAA